MSKNHKHKSNGKLEVTENPNYVAPEETTYDIPRGWPKYPVFPDSGSVPGAPIQFAELTPDSVRAGYTFTDPNMIGEVDEYFYHGDHISSVVLVTDKRATIVQSFAYMPYGELLVEGSSVELDYRFSAKETDRETGLSYFGARYYDPTAAMWLGTDPLWEKYVGMNPYNYCAGNPVGLVDVDGRKFVKENKAMSSTNKHTSDEDFELFLKSVDDIIAHGGEIGKMLLFLKENENFSIAVYINYNGNNYYDDKTGILAWDPTEVVLTDKGYKLPPIVNLAHESRHAYDANVDWYVDFDDNNKYYNILFFTESEINGPNYREDNAVHSETECAKLYYIIPPEETCTRNNYNYDSYEHIKSSNIYEVVEE